MGVAVIGLVIWLAVVLVFINLAARLVRAAERIADELGRIGAGEIVGRIEGG